MNNLFVCHTQYNLMLATGLVLSDFKNDKNDLILFEDFNITESLKKELKSLFQNLIFINHLPVVLSPAKEKMDRIMNDIKLLKSWIDTSYDRLFIVDDMCIQEMFIMKQVFQINDTVEMSWLEDGASAYFNTGVVSSGMGSSALKRFIRKTAFTIMFNLYGFYDLAVCVGAHKRLTKIYLTFPNARKELIHKDTVLISQESVEKGMKVLYPGNSFEADEGSVLIALDKLDRYGDNLNTVHKIVEDIVKKCKLDGRTVYYKFHPRENQTIPCLKDCIQLDKTIAAESYLIHCPHRNLQVVGIMTTTLQTALKLRYDAISYIKLMNNSNPEIAKFYENIGIKCPNSL